MKFIGEIQGARKRHSEINALSHFHQSSSLLQWMGTNTETHS